MPGGPRPRTRAGGSAERHGEGLRRVSGPDMASDITRIFSQLYE